MEIYNEFRETLLKEQNEFSNQEIIKALPKIGDLCVEHISNNQLNNFIKQSRGAIDLTLKDLEESKVFEIDEETKATLEETDNKIYVRHLPFNTFFIDCEIEIEGVDYSGFLIKKDNVGIVIKTFGNFLTSSDLPIPIQRKKQIVMIPLVDTKEEQKLAEEILKKVPTQPLLKNFTPKDKIKKFICNFLDFLNHPDVEMRVIKWFNNENRIRKGKPPIPDKARITINGKLYRYIYESFPQMRLGSSPSHSFWVRGHYMHFWDEERWNKIYIMEINDLKHLGYQVDEDDGLIKKWVFAYIKGEGKTKEVIRVIKKHEK